MTRLDRATAPLILSLGSRMHQGKSDCAKTIFQKFNKSTGGVNDIVLTGFAAALRKEVELAIEGIDGDGLTIADKVKELCLLCGVDYDPEAPISPDYPYSKQRALLQFWGQWRRDQDPFHWIKALEQSIIERKPQIVLIDDMRYPNELFWTRHLGGSAIRVTREGYQAPAGTSQHISETALDGYEFDYTITSQEGQVDQLRSDAVELFDAIVKRWSGAECASFFQTFGESFAVQER